MFSGCSGLGTTAYARLGAIRSPTLVAATVSTGAATT
jgi:hypothetical protein